jgi:hypothetical protein
MNRLRYEHHLFANAQIMVFFFNILSELLYVMVLEYVLIMVVFLLTQDYCSCHVPHAHIG